MRIGHGYDVHRLVEGRDLILGGVKIDYEKGLDGHSDADVLLHAVSDALLGAAGLGDIGRRFPDTDPKFKGAVFPAASEKCGGKGRRGRLSGEQHRRDHDRSAAEAEGFHPADGGKYCPRGRNCPFPGKREGHHGGKAGFHWHRRRHGLPRGVPVGGMRKARTQIVSALELCKTLFTDAAPCEAPGR